MELVLLIDAIIVCDSPKGASIVRLLITPTLCFEGVHIELTMENTSGRMVN